MHLTTGKVTLTLPSPSLDVVTISSSSEDDCILLSEPSSEEEPEAADDPTNSGMHTNDAYNIPDETGRVLVNVGHPEADADIFLAPQIARIIKPHQVRSQVLSPCLSPYALNGLTYWKHISEISKLSYIAIGHLLDG
jgi:hypothetical protein